MELIKELRSLRGISQSELAKACGVSQQRVSAMESSDMNIMCGTLARVAGAMGVRLILVAEMDGEEALRTELVATEEEADASHG